MAPAPYACYEVFCTLGFFLIDLFFRTLRQKSLLWLGFLFFESVLRGVVTLARGTKWIAAGASFCIAVTNNIAKTLISCDEISLKDCIRTHSTDNHTQHNE